MRNTTSAKSFNLLNKKKKKRQSQFIFLIFSLLIIITALVFTVSKIGQSQDNRQQAWDGGNPYTPDEETTEGEGGPSPEECTSVPAPEGCSEYLDNCKNCRDAGVVCEGCGEYNNLADKCSGLSGLLGIGGEDCLIIDSLSDESETIVTEAPLQEVAPTEVPQKMVSATPTEVPWTMTSGTPAPTEVPWTMTSGTPAPTEVPEDSLRVKTKIYLLNLIEKL